MQQGLNKNNQASPVFSMSTVRWYQPNAINAGVVLDVYEDGRVNLLFGDAYVSFNESNDELWMSVKPNQLKQLVNELQGLKFAQGHRPTPCDAGCIENLTNIVTLNLINNKSIITLQNTAFNNDAKLSNADLIKLYKIVEKYFPLSQLQCDADIGEGRNTCYQIYQEILKPTKKEEK